MQFVDARKLQEGLQQDVWRGVQRERGRGVEGRRGRRPESQVGGRALEEGGALFGLTGGGMDSRRMGDVKIGWARVAAVAHKLSGAGARGRARSRAASCDASSRCWPTAVWVQKRDADACADTDAGTMRAERASSTGRAWAAGGQHSTPRARCSEGRGIRRRRVSAVLNPCCGEWFAGIRRG